MRWIPISETNPFRLPFYLSAAALVLAILPWPGGFYAIMRIVICACAAYGAWRLYQRGNSEWAWVMGVIAVVYNPFIWVKIGGQFWWLVINVVALVLIYGATLVFQGRRLRDAVSR